VPGSGLKSPRPETETDQKAKGPVETGPFAVEQSAARAATRRSAGRENL
jgi:hypothetical protein